MLAIERVGWRGSLGVFDIGVGVQNCDEEVHTNSGGEGAAGENSGVRT